MWAKNKLITGRYPMPSEIKRWNYDIIINVSDEYIESCHLAAATSGKLYHWFPLTEATNMGLNSIYAALQILHIAESKNQSVYLHCHAGANRSVLIYQLYCIMTNVVNRVEMEIVHENITCGVLPHINEILRFLQGCKETRHQADYRVRGLCGTENAV